VDEVEETFVKAGIEGWTLVAQQFAMTVEPRVAVGSYCGAVQALSCRVPEATDLTESIPSPRSGSVLAHDPDAMAGQRHMSDSRASLRCHGGDSKLVSGDIPNLTLSILHRHKQLFRRPTFSNTHTKVSQHTHFPATARGMTVPSPIHPFIPRPSQKGLLAVPLFVAVPASAD
jgi:hypothetical protein